GLPRTRSLSRQTLLASGLRIHNITLRTRKLFHQPQESEWIGAVHLQSPYLMLAQDRRRKSKHSPGSFAGGNFVDAFMSVAQIRQRQCKAIPGGARSIGHLPRQGNLLAGERGFDRFDRYLQASQIRERPWN